jgi:putative phage-type endonuclease
MHGKISIRKEDFHQQRQMGIGGTDMSAIMGKNPFRGEMDVWLDKTGRAEKREASEAAMFGLILEPVVADYYAKTQKIPKNSLVANIFAAHSQYPMVIGHPDRLVRSKETPGTFSHGIEIKTTDKFNIKNFGEENTDDIPEPFIIQVQHYMGIFDLPYFHVPVLIGGNTYRLYRVNIDTELIHLMQEYALDWWQKYVMTDTPPPIDGSKASANLLKRLYPTSLLDPVEIVYGDVLQDDIRRYALLDLIADKIETAKGLHKNRIISRIGDAAGLVTPWGEVSYKKDKDSAPSTDWEKVAETIAYKHAFELVVKLYPDTAKDNPEQLQDAVNEAAKNILTNTKALFPKEGRKGSRKFLFKIKDEFVSRWADEFPEINDNLKLIE